MIRSTFAGFNMAQSALLASQRALDVTGQNLSNIDTTGYTRQRLDLASITPQGASFWHATNEVVVGQGVLMTDVIQIRDPFLDIQYRNQVTEVGTDDAIDTVLERIGNIFDETDSTAVRSAMNDVISQLKTLASTPNSSEDYMDDIVRSSFEVLLSNIKKNSQELIGLEEELVSKMDDTLIPNVNTILEQIAQANANIKQSEILGYPALELKDQRNSLIDDLATYMPIEIKYTDSGVGEDKIELLTIYFTDSAGNKHTLLDDEAFGSMDFTNPTGERPYGLTLNAVGDPAPAPISIENLLGEGVLKGNYDMLNKSESFDEPISDVRGIGYYEKMFNSYVSQIATTMNELNAIQNPDGTVTEVNLFETTDGSTEFTAENIKISDDWYNGLIKLTRTQEQGAGGTDNSTAYENILKMVNALDSDTIQFTGTKSDGSTFIAFEGSMKDAYDILQNTQAIDRKSSSTMLDNEIKVLNQIMDARDSVSGVNQDEEIMSLMKYQQSYNAASRLMTTLDEILDKLINGTGVVGR